MSRFAAWLSLLLFLFGAFVPATAATVPPPPDPGLAASLRAADVIAEVEILAGGPFRAVASVRRVYRGTPPRVFELSGYNSLNWDATSASFEAGSRWILFLSNTDRPDTFATLTPSAPRLPVKAGSVLLSLGDPPFRLPIPEADMRAAMELMASAEPDVERGVALVRELWARNEVEARYLATALAGWLGDARVVPLLAEVSKDKLLRLRLLAVDALKRIAAPESLAVLRSMLKDERDIVTREAAAALVDAQDADAVPELLAWARRAAEARAKLPEDDSRRKTGALYINRLLLLLLDVGPLLPRESFAPGLLSLARSPDAETGKTALFVLDRLAGREEIDRLIELADDPVYPLAREAAFSLYRASLRPATDLDAFREWWKGERGNFGEASRVRRVREATVGLSLGAIEDLSSVQMNVLLSAPSEIVLPEIAQLFLDERGSLLFETRHLAAWRGPFVLPFILSRLTADDAQDRALALQSLSILLQQHPRLAPVLRPMIRAHLADPEPLVRRMACSACGLLGDAPSFPLLLMALNGGISYEANEAAQAVFDLSSRTLGYAYHELAEDNDVALKRLSAWWEKLGEARRSTWRPPTFTEARRTSFMAFDKIGALLTGEESRPAGAAMALMLEQRPASDPLWTRLLESKRARDRAHGVAGLLGAPATAGVDLAAVLKREGDGSALPQALALPVLASLRGGRGPDLVVEWLDGPGAGTSLAWRSLAITSLGLSDGEPRSLAWLQKTLASELAAEPVPDAFETTTTRPETRLLRAVLLALATRADGAAVLTAALKSRSPVHREWAARTIAIRNRVEATTEVLAALDQADRYNVSDLARAVAPLTRAGDANALAALLLNGTESGRLAAAVILSRRPQLGAEPVLRGALIQALQDTTSYVRSRAAECLGRMQARAAVPSLEALLSDIATEPRTAAIEAIGRIGDRTAARAAAVETRSYTQIDPRWMPVLGLSDADDDLRILLTSVQSESWIQRRGALKGLGLSQRPEALKYLLGAFRELRSPYHTHVGEALARHGQAATEALSPELKAPNTAVRAAVLSWLERCPGPVGNAQLLEALRDADAGVRQLADWVLRRRTDKEAGFDAQAPDGQREESIKRWRTILAP
jgi:HEAT repeat protein